MSKHHIHWEYEFNSEFFYKEEQDDEYFDNFEDAKARVFELLSGWRDYKFNLTIAWYDGDCTGEPYRIFTVAAPDRG